MACVTMVRVEGQRGNWNAWGSIHDYRRLIGSWTALLQHGNAKENHVNRIRMLSRASTLVASTALFMLTTGTALASDELEVKSLVEKWVADLNKGDLKSFVAACAPHAAVVDGFPPYARQSCADWMKDYNT